MNHNNLLPHLSDQFFLTDGGLETTLVFHKGFDLPHFAAFDELKHDSAEIIRTVDSPLGEDSLGQQTVLIQSKSPDAVQQLLPRDMCFFALDIVDRVTPEFSLGVSQSCENKLIGVGMKAKPRNLGRAGNRHI